MQLMTDNDAMDNDAMDPAEAFAHLGRIKLSDTDLDGVLTTIATLAKRTIPGAGEVSVTLVRGTGVPRRPAAVGAGWSSAVRSLSEEPFDSDGHGRGCITVWSIRKAAVYAVIQGVPIGVIQSNGAVLKRTAVMSRSAVTPDGGARVPIPPPLYYAAGFVTGLVAHRAAPLPIGGRPASTMAGLVVVAGGVGLANAGFATVIRHHTTVVPHHPVSALVTTGVYRYTRNPMYTGLAIAYVGGSLIAGSWWPLLILPPIVGVVRRLAIDPEERYLADRFGATYDDYRSRVPRWLPITARRIAVRPRKLSS